MQIKEESFSAKHPRRVSSGPHATDFSQRFLYVPSKTNGRAKRRYKLRELERDDSRTTDGLNIMYLSLRSSRLSEDLCNVIIDEHDLRRET